MHSQGSRRANRRYGKREVEAGQAARHGEPVRSAASPPLLRRAKRLKELEREKVRLRKAVADLTLDEMILRQASRENQPARSPEVPSPGRGAR